jgi:putative ABC transport system ATP-binding protein
MEEPTGGSILYQNQPIHAYVPHHYRQEVALVYQTPIFFSGTALENLQKIDAMNKRSIRPLDFYEHTLEQVGLSKDKLFQEALNLSLGEKQRLSVARTLLNQPKILLLDEPISALDSTSAERLLTTLIDLNRNLGMTMLIVTHQKPPIPIGNKHWKFLQDSIIEENMP